mmetsp:Transcript_8172/g.21047  ORF Transcript_8172/g.21047 Transcript_8172/m.21047 type:complete len:139 (+) Transcript_8172:1057-1473(+)
MGSSVAHPPPWTHATAPNAARSAEPPLPSAAGVHGCSAPHAQPLGRVPEPAVPAPAGGWQPAMAQASLRPHACAAAPAGCAPVRPTGLRAQGAGAGMSAAAACPPPPAQHDHAGGGASGSMLVDEDEIEDFADEDAFS